MRYLSALLLASGLACSSSAPSPRDTTSVQAPDPESALSSKTVLDLVDVTVNPTRYEWFDFRPNVKKLILAGAPETQHVAILWYTVPDGRVPLHRHAKTEAVYVIDGAQTDAKGTYSKGTVYFNPPGSGHEIQDSSGFFLLAYAAAPDFKNTSELAGYTPVRIDTSDSTSMRGSSSPPAGSGVRTLDIALDGSGGMSGRLIELTLPEDRYEYVGNYLLVLDGSCRLAETTVRKQSLVVARSVIPESFPLAAAGGPCRVLGVSF
jgi:quercetin dioxygenase-like cupin family protein